ncbi:unnamed protein product, partial [Ascophyllum nodosum]
AHLTFANLAPAGGAHAVGVEDGGDGSSLSAYFASLVDPSLEWGDIKWLRTIC